MSTYANRLRKRLDLKSEPNFGVKRMQPSDDYLEQRFEENLLGGFSRKRVCPTCRVALPTTNQCDSCA